MKTAVILSDTHGNISGIEKLLPIINENDFLIHLGDCQQDLLPFNSDIKAKLLSVKGNCDNGDEEVVLNIEGVKIFITHGNKYGVKKDLYKLFLRAKELGVTVVFYGHTHQSNIQQIDGITFVNPGAFSGYSERSYCYSIFHKGKTTNKIVSINY